MAKIDAAQLLDSDVTHRAFNPGACSIPAAEGILPRMAGRFDLCGCMGLRCSSLRRY